jgi:outer membrane protein assembly factor BamB
VGLKGQIRWPILLVLVTIPLTVALLSRPGRAFLIRTIHGVPPTDDPQVEVPYPSVVWEPIVVNSAANTIERYRKPGERLWSTSLREPLGPDWRTSIATDEKRVYVGFAGGVVALDVDSGQSQWQCPAECEQMLLDQDLVLTIERDSSLSDRRGSLGLAARNCKTGKSVFKVSLPNAGEFKKPMALNGLIVVVCERNADSGITSLLITRQGRLRNTLDCLVLDGCEDAGTEYYLTGDDVRQLTPEGREGWNVPLRSPSLGDTGGELRIMDGDLIASLYGRHSNSGVRVARIDRNHGTLVWTTYSQGLRVEHSEYTHRAKLKLIDGRFLEVLSRGSKGSFVEVLDLSSGLSLLRKLF